MHRLSQFLKRVVFLCRRGRMDRELDEEMEFHIEMKAREYREDGLGEEEARLAARRQFGNRTRHKEESRQFWGFRWLDVLLQDLRYARRALWKSPSFTAVSVLSLALGIGVNATVFGFVNALMLRPLPLPGHDELVRIQDDALPAYSDYLAYNERAEVFDGLAAFYFDNFNLSVGESSAREGVAIVTGNYFEVLGVRPALGRTFTPEDGGQAGAAPTAVISHGLWQRRFGSDPGVVGRSVLLDRSAFTIVGVAPKGFTGVSLGWRHDLYIPTAAEAILRPGGGPLKHPDSHPVRVIGRLRRGVNLAQARAAVEVVAAQQDLVPKERLFSDNPGEQPPTPRGVSPATALELGPRGRRQAWLGVAAMLAVMGLVLLVACANVANLLLGRAAGRRREIAVRLAMGAGRGRIVRQLLTESILLSLLGGAAGLVLSFWAGDLILSVLPQHSPSEVSAVTLDLSPDWRMLLYSLLLAVATGVAFGLVPALQTSRPDLVAALKAETAPPVSARRLNFRNALVVTQVAVSTLLLIPAGLLVRNISLARSADYGFPTDDRYVAAVDMGGLGYDDGRQESLREELLERVRAIPGVRSATMSHLVPLAGGTMVIPLEVEGEDPGRQAPDVFTENGASVYALDQPGSLYLNTVDTGYFQTMGIPLSAGREFTERDGPAGPDVVIVNETLARRLAPGGQALGKRLIEREPSEGQMQTRFMEVVGVAKDVKYIWPTERPRYFAYRPLRQRDVGAGYLTVHGPKDLGAVAGGVRAAARSVDPALSVERFDRLDEMIDRRVGETKIVVWVSGLIGALALALASVGLYGVMAYTVAGRTKEIGIRVALGASRGRVRRMVLADGLALAAAGTLAGLLAAAASMRVMRSLLYGVSPTDPLTYLLVSLFLTAVALLACYIPARRATRVDPMVALRYE